MKAPRPELKAGHPHGRGLVLFLPWNRGGVERQGGFAKDGFFELAKLGGVSAPTWFPDSRFGLVPDFGNDTNNRALTGVSTALESANISPLTVSAWVWPHVIEDNAVVFGKWVTSQAGWLLRLRLSTGRPGLRFEVQHQTTALVATIDAASLHEPANGE